MAFMRDPCENYSERMLLDPAPDIKHPYQGYSRTKSGLGFRVEG